MPNKECARDNQCFLFDIDGTLTPARERMAVSFASFFANWQINKNVFLVSGSDMPKIKEQVPSHILQNCTGVFSCMGNEHWKDDSLVYQNELELAEEIEEWLADQIDTSDFHYRKPPHFEYRSGSLNFSVVGRGASEYLRRYYSEWDDVNKERETIAENFNKNFKNKYNTEALIGGQISLDIQQIGNDKGQIIKHLAFDDTIFFGDKCYEGGNDYALAQKVTHFHQVKGWEHTQKILSEQYQWTSQLKDTKN